MTRRERILRWYPVVAPLMLFIGIAAGLQPVDPWWNGILLVIVCGYLVLGLLCLP